MVRRAAPVLALAAAWCAWTVFGARLDRPSRRRRAPGRRRSSRLPLARVSCSRSAAGFHDQRPVLIGTTAIGLVLAVGGTLADLPTVGGSGQDRSRAGALGMLFIPLLDRAWHVAVVALLVIGVDTYSVVRGTDEAAAGVGRRRDLDVHRAPDRARRVRRGRPRRHRLPVPRPLLRRGAALAAAAAADDRALRVCRSRRRSPSRSCWIARCPRCRCSRWPSCCRTSGASGRARPTGPWELRTHPATTANSRAQRRRATRPPQPLGVGPGRLLGAARPADRAGRDRRHRRRRQLRRPAADPRRGARRPGRPARPRSGRVPRRDRARAADRCARSCRPWRSTPAAATPTASRRRSRPAASRSCRRPTGARSATARTTS